mmetsp:Transcript_62618/g.193917  ORF Transcript_62618/g.193917 Transcript_62618/m.193917 type:complete len:289 (+) Transcript_62618:1020-1886(+)
MVKEPSSFGMPGKGSLSSAYAALSSNGSLRKKVMTFSRFISEFCGKTTADFSAGRTSTSPPPAGVLIQPTLTGNAEVSSTLNSLTLYSFERIAAWRAHPRATHSSAFMVVESSLPPNALEHMSLTQGTREAPPQISTASMEETARPLAALAASSTSLTFFIMGLHISSKSERLMLLLKSSSSMRHSHERLDSEFAERIFLVFVTASSSLKSAFLLDRTSQPVFFWNCLAKVRMRHSSMSRPPTFWDLSQTTESWPRTNCTMATEKSAWPIWQNATVRGLSVLKLFVRK